MKPNTVYESVIELSKLKTQLRRLKFPDPLNDSE